MRMSDTVDPETMKVSEAADAAMPPARDDAAAADSEAADQSQSGGGDKSDAQDGFLPQPSEKEERAAQDQVEKEDCCDKADKPEKTQRKMLSRDSSQDYTDSTGIDLHEFLVNTLKGNPRDRIMLLKLEQDILDFISNNESHKRKFPPMTSYHRMLLHRVAAYFGMDHNVDPSGKSVVINKTGNTRIPDQKFSEHIKDDRTDDFQKRYILKRDNSSFDRDESSIRMRLKADKRSKSMEEREEEYQRVRERIFAHDGDHFILDRSAQDEGACMSTQQRRQMFRLRAGRSGASRQSSSETETLPRHGEPRPWSSTDSSDSSNRLAPRPPITKASSFSGISPGLVRGDSTASSKSTGRLSKTGSESCSSVGSSSSSLSRPQLPLAVSAPSWSGIPGAPLLHPAADARGSGHPEMVKSVPPQPPPPPPAATGYYVLPLEASGIPPGSVLVNPHTGKPFIHPDGSAVVYNPAGRSQQGKTPTQPPANHLHAQPDALSAQFGHMTLAQQQQPGGGGGGVASVADARHYSAVYHHHHHHAAPMMLQGGPQHHHQQHQQHQQQQQHQQHQQQVASYMVAGPSGVHPALLQGQPVSLPAPGAPNHPYPSSTPGPASFPGSALNQQLLQQHAYIQQPVQQMSACYCSSAPHPHCSGQQQHYRPPGNPLPYSCPQSPNLPQQQVHQAMMPPPASSYQAIVGMQPTSSLALTGNQQSNMGSQIQGMMVQYPPMQSYQQLSVPQQTYQQPVFVSCQPGQGPVAVAGMQPCYSLLPPNQHTTMSSTVSFLPAQMMEQLQFSQTSAPCVSQQHPGQQYAGLLPSGPGGGGGMVMLQMTAPSCQQPRAPSPCQRKQPAHKQPGGEHQRGRRLAELPAPADSAQSSLPSSPALSPSAGQPLVFKGLPAGISSIPVVARHPHHHPLHHLHHHPLHPPLPTAFCHSGPGEAHYSLLGQPLQFKPSIRPPLIHAAHMVATHQGPLGVWRSAHGRKASRKPLSSDLSVGEAVSSQILDVTDPLDSHHLLAELCRGGELIQRLSDHQPRLRSAARDSPGGRLASSYSIFAMLPPRYAAPSAGPHRAGPRATFELRTSARHSGELCGPDGAGS